MIVAIGSEALFGCEQSKDGHCESPPLSNGKKNDIKDIIVSKVKMVIANKAKQSHHSSSLTNSSLRSFLHCNDQQPMLSDFQITWKPHA